MKKLLCFIACMCCMILGAGTRVSAATPRVMVSDYSIKEDSVISGKEFNITITLKNTAKKAVKNVKVSLLTTDGEFLPVQGAGTAYVEQIDAETEVDLSFHMMAISGLSEKSYKLAIKTEYENTSGMEYMVEESIFIPVTHEMRVSVTDVFLAESQVELGDVVEISAVVNNMGAGTLYNVMAMVKGDNIEDTSTYIGNIEAGKSGMLDVLTKARIATKGDHIKNKIYITYEDQKGHTYESDVAFEVMVTEPIYEDLEKVKEEVSYSAVTMDIVKWIVLIIMFAGVIWLWIRRKKRKQQILDEFVN